MAYGEKPASISQEVWEEAGAMGLDLWPEGNEVKLHDGSGYFFRSQTTLSPETAEQDVQNALATPYPSEEWSKR